MTPMETAALIAKGWGQLVAKIGQDAADDYRRRLGSYYTSCDDAARWVQLRGVLKREGVILNDTAPAPVASSQLRDWQLVPGDAEPSEPEMPEADTAPAPDHQRRSAWRQPAAAASWRARRRGPTNKEVVTMFAMLPKYVDAEVRAAMPKTVLCAYLGCIDEADLDGCFQMPAGQLAELIGRNRRNAQHAMDALRDAGLLRVVHPGGPRTPNVWGLIPWRQFDKAHAIKALTLRREARTRGIVEAKAAKAARTESG